MNNLHAIPAKRLFLPSSVRLQSNDSDARATLVTSYDDGRAHAAHVEELYKPFGGDCAPFLWLDDEESEVVVVEADRALGTKLRDFGFFRKRGCSEYTLLLEASTVVGVLRWALDQGIGLCEDAWYNLEAEGHALGARDLGRKIEDPKFGTMAQGAWSELFRSHRGRLRLRDRLRDAIQCADDSAVHYIPLPCGGQLYFPEDHAHWVEDVDGCGALVIKREGSSLSVYLPSQDWLSWGLQRALLDAWADESFGEDVAWHWG